MSSKTGPCRALIAKGLGRFACTILATDNQQLADSTDASSYVGDLLGGDFVPDEPGLYLFEGEGVWRVYGYESNEPECTWEGRVRRVTSDEYEGLMAMTPPEPDESEDAA